MKLQIPGRILQMTLAAAVVLVALFPAFAQRPGGRPGGDPEKMIEARLNRMEKDLELNASQKNEIKPILEDEFKKLQAVREKHGPPESGQRPSDEAIKEVRAIQEETRNRISKVLTTDQQEKLKSLGPERGPVGRRGRGPRP